MRLRPLVVAAGLVVPGAAFAQAADSLNLQGRSVIVLGIGLTGSREATASATGVTTHADGDVGSIGFRHFVTPRAAVEITAAFSSASATTVAGRLEANAVTPILFGLRVAPRALALGPSLRPFVSAAAGPFVHSMAAAFAASASDQLETAPGARVAAGADWLIGRHFELGVAGSYDAVGTFDHPDATTRGASGFGMTLAFGVAWGGR